LVFTAAQSAELWERWKKGEGLKSIGRAFGKPSSCIFAHLRPSGGIMPPARRRSRLALTMAEREEISRGIVEGHSVRAIARMLARAASTVSREISRNGGVGRYRAAAADKLAWKQDLAAHSQAELNKVARQLNERPRKTLDFQSPAERFSQCVAATG
jgi:IS30 family transposase